jgi:hypothetical protein
LTSAAGVVTLADDNRAVNMLVAVTSSSMFVELVVRMGHSPEEAVSIALELAWLVIDARSPI